jgi:hypothetical protein
MAVVIAASLNTGAPVAPAVVSLAVSGDSLVGNLGEGQELWLYNTSASEVVVTIDGDEATTVVVPGTGGLAVSVAEGLQVPVAAESFVVVALGRAKAYLQGEVAITASVAGVVKATVVTVG